MWKKLETWLLPDAEAKKNEQRRVERYELLKQLKESIQQSFAVYKRKNRFHTEGEEFAKLENYDGAAVLLCYRLERCLQYGLKVRNENAQMSLWMVLNRLLTVLSDDQAHIQKTIQKVSQQERVETSLGKSRAWIRYCLNVRVLHEAIQLLCSDQCRNIREHYYDPWALMRCTEGSHVIEELVLCLKEARFNLLVNDEQLDIADGPNFILPVAYEGNESPGFNFDSILNSMEETLNNLSSQADDYISQATRAFSDRQKGIASWQHVFGTPIEDLLRLPYHSRYAAIDVQLAVPNVVDTCVDILTAECDTPRLFRSFVSQDRMETAKDYIERHGQVPPSTDVHLAGAILLQFLKELPEPLLTRAKYDAFVTIVDIEEREVCARNLGLLVGQLPWAHLPTLEKLLQLWILLQKPEHAEKNGLNKVAISIFFSPAILRISQITSSLDVTAQQNQDMRLAAVGSKVIERMIDYHDTVQKAIADQLQANRKRIAKKTSLLAKIGKNLGEPFDYENPLHEDLLRELWTILCSHFEKHDAASDEEKENEECDFVATPEGQTTTPTVRSYSRFSNLWQIYGFTDTDPCQDFTIGGMLHMQCLLYFVKNYDAEALQIMRSRAEGKPTDYNTLIAGGTLVRLLAGILRLIDTPDSAAADLVEMSKQPYWRLTDDPLFFPKIVSFALLLFEHNWREEKATQEHFDRVIHDSKQQLIWLLNRSPHSVDDLWRIWLDLRRQKFETLSRSSHMSSNSSTRLFSPISTSRITDVESPNAFEIGDENHEEFGIDAEDASLEDYLTPSTCKIKKTVDGITSRLTSVSEIFSVRLAEAVEASLPLVSQEKDWDLLYSISVHGASLHTLLNRCKGQSPTILVLRTAAGEIFGGYASEKWHITHGYFGTGESFIFKASSNGFQVYRWNPKSNTYFMFCHEESIAMGGGKNFAFFLDADLASGTTGECETFNSPSLTESGTFDCAMCEVWGLSVSSLHPLSDYGM